MDFLLLLVIPATTALVWFLVVHGFSPRRDFPARVSHEVRVIAGAVSPARDLAATLPRRDAARRARLDRHFGYERDRRPSYQPDLSEERAAQLRPVQVIHVKSVAEREALSEGAPKHLKVVFIEEEDPEVRVTVPLPRPRPGRS